MSARSDTLVEDPRRLLIIAQTPIADWLGHRNVAMVVLAGFGSHPINVYNCPRVSLRFRRPGVRGFGELRNQIKGSRIGDPSRRAAFPLSARSISEKRSNAGRRRPGPETGPLRGELLSVEHLEERARVLAASYTLARNPRLRPPRLLQRLQETARAT